MRSAKVTLLDYVIAGVGLVTMLPFFVFREPLASALGTSPKIVSGLGTLAAVVIMLGLSMLKARQTPRKRWPVRPWHRLFGLAVLGFGVAYFFAREEIAEALHWRIKFGDALMTFFGVLAVTWFLRQLPPIPTDDDVDPPSN